MKIYRLHRTQELPVSVNDAWEYFSEPANLPLITPPWLDFRITSDVPEKMYPGMMIEYTVTPLLNIPVKWVSEITYVSEPRYFVDEQRFGPYRLWHHEHHFREIIGGVLVEDLVHYALPLDPLSRPVNEFFVKKQLKEIFDFRKSFLEKEFGSIA